MAKQDVAKKFAKLYAELDKTTLVVAEKLASKLGLSITDLQNTTGKQTFGRERLLLAIVLRRDLSALGSRVAELVGRDPSWVYTRANRRMLAQDEQLKKRYALLREYMEKLPAYEDHKRIIRNLKNPPKNGATRS